MDEKQIFEYIYKTTGSEAESLTPVNGGLSATEKYKAKVNGQEWMVKISTGNSTRDMWYRELEKRSNAQMANPKMHKLFEDGTLCLLSPWINGESLEYKLRYATNEQVQNYGIQAAQILCELHKEPFDYPEYSKKFASRVNNACDEVEQLGLNFPGHKQCCSYLKDKIATYSTKHVCFVHKDVRPENFIVKKEKIHLIDFDNGSLGERVADFSYLTTMGGTEFFKFSRVLIEKYLELINDNGFWEKNLLYSTLQVVEYAIWKWKVKGRQVYYQAENLMNQYDNFRAIKPYWWDNI